MSITVREVAQDSSEGVTVVDLGAGTQAGDLLVLSNGTDFYTINEMESPSGAAASWNHVPAASADDGTNGYHLRVWWGVVVSGGAQSVAVPQSGNDACNHARVRVLAGTDTGDPIDDAAGESSNHLVSPSLNVSGTDSLLLSDIIGDPGDYTAPAGMVSETEVDCGGFSTSNGAHEPLTGSGPTGTREWSDGPGSSALASVAVRAASGGESAAGSGVSFGGGFGSGAGSKSAPGVLVVSGGAAALGTSRKVTQRAGQVHGGAWSAAGSSRVAVGRSVAEGGAQPAASGSRLSRVAGVGWVAGVGSGVVRRVAGSAGMGWLSGLAAGLARRVAGSLGVGFGGGFARQAAASSETPETPADRVVVVSAESRVVAVSAESRATVVSTEGRVLDG